MVEGKWEEALQLLRASKDLVRIPLINLRGFMRFAILVLLLLVVCL